jgi:hypothetical protein
LSYDLPCRSRQRRNFIYFIEYFRKAAGILLLGVWCKNIRYNIPIITLVGVWPDDLSPLEKLDHPQASPRLTLLFSGRQIIGSHSNKGDNCILSSIFLLVDSCYSAIALFYFLLNLLFTISLYRNFMFTWIRRGWRHVFLKWYTL